MDITRLNDKRYLLHNIERYRKKIQTLQELFDEDKISKHGAKDLGYYICCFDILEEALEILEEEE